MKAQSSPKRLAIAAVQKLLAVLSFAMLLLRQRKGFSVVKVHLRRVAAYVVHAFAFLKRKPRTVRVALAVVLLMFFSGTISGFMLARVMSAPQANSVIANVGSVGTVNTVGVGVYWDSGFASKVNMIDWGTLMPGTQKSHVVYIRNEGNLPITLSQTVSNWNPVAAASYMSLSWSYNGQTIYPGGAISVTLTLSVNSGITGISQFSFDINIVGTA